MGGWHALASAAERHGFDGLYTSDHYLSETVERDRDALDAWGTICGLAITTSRIRLGTIVSPATFRHPSVLAKLVVTADHLSAGRVDLGWAQAGSRTSIGSTAFRFPSQRTRMEILEEQVEIVCRSWEEGAFSFSGGHYEITRLDAQPKPVQQPRPRLVIGGQGGPRSIALAARWADEYNSPLPTAEEISVRRAALEKAFERTVALRPRPACRSWPPCSRAATGGSSSSAQRRSPGSREGRHRSRRVPRAVPETWIVGTPEQIVARLRELAALGRRPSPPRADASYRPGMVELIGRQVVPSLRPMEG